MPISQEIFDDPRAKPRSSSADDQKLPCPDVEELPEAEYDWYLKRKPIVSYIISSKKDAEERNALALQGGS